ncbi:aminopeptidase O isoform X1 [Alosa sapidissima]|uniref:aminopeptidase O isoform X1 n=1 Tax=Alosa sapidissima TaxID=34773 RepID=UPI001C091995|nr:aminopeptidase O isoform X1 [Alosa sapidissima]
MAEMQSAEESDLDPNKDDLPLRANTNHMLVRHYVLDLTIHFESKTIGGSIVLFLEPGKGKSMETPDSAPSGESTSPSPLCEQPKQEPQLHLQPQAGASQTEVTVETCDHKHVEGTEARSWQEGASDEFTLVLDCCDLSVSKVEEVDVASVPGMRALLDDCEQPPQAGCLSFTLVERLLALSSSCWKEQHDLYLQCSTAPCPQGAAALSFHTDRWSLQLRKRGVGSPSGFPRALRIWYETKPKGASVRWTDTQDGRCCVYTMGSPINNRALFPCQEPPVAMSTWQATVVAPGEYTVLLSGENQVVPVQKESGLSRWAYYVTMPMPASTFTLAVGQWHEAQAKSGTGVPVLTESSNSSTPGVSTSGCSSVEKPCHGSNQEFQGAADGPAQSMCAHVDYPCRFTLTEAWQEAIIPHRVFSPTCLLPQVETVVVPHLPACLAAAHAVLGVHPFSHLDVLIVPSGFSSLGMASPHIVFLSQSVLMGPAHLCGARLCHEIAHAWFGLVIGARDWTEEWISEGFATFLEDVLWAKVQQLSLHEEEDQLHLRALLRWRRLHDELQNAEQELQILRPHKESTGVVSESGASTVKHGLNPEKPFMQVHYLKGYFLLKFLASFTGHEQFLAFLRLFVSLYHGRLVLSQDFLRMLLDHFPDVKRRGLTLEGIYADWLDAPGIPKWLTEESAAWLQSPLVTEVQQEVTKWIHFSRGHGKGTKRKRGDPCLKVNFKEMGPEQTVLLLEMLLEEEKMSAGVLQTLERTYDLRTQDAEVKHRWCELVVKHKYSAAYKDVEDFLIDNQAMGVYLYGELMLQEDGRQQALARRCFSRAQEHMDPAALAVVSEMIL